MLILAMARTDPDEGWNEDTHEQLLVDNIRYKMLPAQESKPLLASSNSFEVMGKKVMQKEVAAKALEKYKAPKRQYTNAEKKEKASKDSDNQAHSISTAPTSNERGIKAVKKYKELLSKAKTAEKAAEKKTKDALANDEANKEKAKKAKEAEAEIEANAVDKYKESLTKTKEATSKDVAQFLFEKASKEVATKGSSASRRRRVVRRRRSDPEKSKAVAVETPRRRRRRSKISLKTLSKMATRDAAPEPIQESNLLPLTPTNSVSNPNDSTSARRECKITHCDGCFGRRRDYVGTGRRREGFNPGEPRYVMPLERRRGGIPALWPIAVGTPESSLVTCIVDFFDKNKNLVVAVGSHSTKTTMFTHKTQRHVAKKIYSYRQSRACGRVTLNWG